MIPKFETRSELLFHLVRSLVPSMLQASPRIINIKLRLCSVSEALRTANQHALDTMIPDVLPIAAELANSRISKIVMVRSDQHASLPLKEFLVVFNEGWSFIIRCEVMARKMIVGLRGVVMSQVLFACNFLLKVPAQLPPLLLYFHVVWIFVFPVLTCLISLQLIYV